MNFPNLVGETALEMASAKGHEAVVEQLLNCDSIDVNHKNVYGNTCLELASMNGHTEVVKMLLGKLSFLRP